MDAVFHTCNFIFAQNLSTKITMKRARKSSQRTITSRIPVELLSQILANPENISLCHTLISAIITAERIRRPEGIAAELDDGNLHPASSPEADSMAENARRRVERAKERRERCLQRTEKRVAILLKVMRDKKPVELSALFRLGSVHSRTGTRHRRTSQPDCPDNQKTVIRTTTGLLHAAFCQSDRH